MYNKILVPVDGSQTCSHVFKAAKEYQEKFDATIILLYVDDSSTFKNYYVDQPMPDLSLDEHGKFRSSEVMTIAVNGLDIPSEKLVSRVGKGDPSSVILDMAKEEEVDLIMLCSHGMGLAKRFLLGTTTTRVVHHAEVPVIILREQKTS